MIEFRADAIIFIEEYFDLQWECCKCFPFNSISTLTTPIPPPLVPRFHHFYSSFFSPDSVLQVSIPNAILDLVTTRISNRNMTLGMFEEAHAQVLQDLYLDLYPQFIIDFKARYNVSNWIRHWS